MDCTSCCRLAGHADVVLSAVTRESLKDVESFVRHFCGNGARVRDSFGRNALHVAASCGKKDVLRWLLEVCQVKVDEKDSESGWTALHRSCYYGYLSCALLLLQYGSNIYEKDVEGMSPIELLMLDSPRKTFLRDHNLLVQGKTQLNKKACCVDVSSWGRNTNFTLGHGDEKERYIPEVIDVFAKRLKVNIHEIVICKFHTIFLATHGSVWTCGHGQGGRLGHGHEKTILYPKKIDALVGHMCIAIAAGKDHNVVLCENGNVFTFGLDKYHQMGHHPPSSQYLTPKQVQIKTLKGKKFVGIAAGKFHTIMMTGKEVYSFGLNAGQLGHSKGDRTQVIPRQVSALHLKGIALSLVTCSDAATVAVTTNGDVYLMYQYTNRRIISKFSNISKLIAVGGCLDQSYKEITEMKSTPLIIYGLYEDGKVFQWRESDKSVRECHWSLQKAISVRDIACGKNLHIVTEQGEVYFEERVSAAVKKPTKILPRNLNFISSHALKQNEVIEVSLARVQQLHRAVKIACDEHSQNFAVIQADPSAGCSFTVRVTPPEMNKHLCALYEDCQQEESHRDVEIKVKGNSLAGHKFILAQGSDKLRRLISDAEAKLSGESRDIPVICIDNENVEITREIIEFLYTGSCPSLRLIDADICNGMETSEIFPSCVDEDLVNELTWSLEEVDFSGLDNLQASISPEVFQIREERRAVALVEEEQVCVPTGDLEKELKDRISVNINPSRRRDLLRVAKKYRISELVSRLQEGRTDRQIHRPRFHRDEFPEYHDVVIEADDGVEYACHKCILTARLEYFSIMLTTGWMESREEFVRLKMPFPSRILEVVIDFLYTDEAPLVRESQDLEFLGKVVTVADQLWIIRLKEICEATMASLISLKNAAEMLEFSSLYNAKELKSVCLEFICLNISCMFEAGSLGFLSDDTLDELSKAYREMIPSMAWRVLTPSDLHLSVPWPQPESPTKRKTTRSQRRSRSSESDVTDSHVVQENGTNQNELGVAKIDVEDQKQKPAQEAEGTRIKDNGKPRSNVERAEKVQVGLWYRKDGGMSPTGVNSTLVSSTGKTKTISNPLTISRRRNDEKKERQPWGGQSLSPQSSDLRAIMEQEKSSSIKDDSQSNERKKEGRSPLGACKSRLSQKERKKLRKSTEEPLSPASTSSQAETDDIPKSSPTPAIKTSPWKSFAATPRPVMSFRQLLEEEENEEKKSDVSGKNAEVEMRRPNATDSVSPVDNMGTSPSAWQSSNLACSPPNNPIKFDKIQELQQQEAANRERSKKKPLSLIQIEDKAIEQLLDHYGGRFNPCELIQVERERKNEGSPNWVS